KAYVSNAQLGLWGICLVDDVQHSAIRARGRSDEPPRRSSGVPAFECPCDQLFGATRGDVPGYHNRSSTGTVAFTIEIGDIAAGQRAYSLRAALIGLCVPRLRTIEKLGELLVGE